ncbi:MAG: flotillin family protein [Myxococcales bacterium]|jgi:flotillin
MSGDEWVVLLGALAGAFVLTVFVILASRYRKVGPNEALVISGGSRGFRIIRGGGTFVWPVIEVAETMSLDVMTIHVHTPAVYTARGVPVMADGIAQIKIDSSSESTLAIAAEQFLERSQDDVMKVALQTVEGHLRAILGTMEVEDIYRDREKFAQKVQEVSASDLRNMGLKIVSFTLRDIKDDQGYLDALGKPRLAEVKREAAVKESRALAEAQIAQAEANRDSAIKSAQAKKEGDVERLKAEAEIALATRDYELKRAEYQASVNQRKAEADLAYDLQRFKTGQLVKKEEVAVLAIEKEQQIAVQEKEILRKEKELEATVQKPADAKRYATQVEADAERYKLVAEAAGRADAAKAQGLAEAEVIAATGRAEAEAIRLKGQAEAEVIKAKGLAEAEAMKKKAESYREYGAAAVTEMFTHMLPELAKAVAEPLAKTEKIVMVSNGEHGGLGASKITHDIANIMAQLPPVVESLSGVSLKDLVSKIPGIEARPPQVPAVPPAVPPAPPKKS